MLINSRLVFPCLAVIMAVLASTAAIAGDGDVAASRKKPVVAVFKLKQTEIHLKQSQLDFLAERLRAALAARGNVDVLSDDVIFDAIADMRRDSDRECETDECRTDLGRRIPADKRLDVTIWKSKQGCTLMAVLYDAKTVVTEQSAQAENLDCSQDGLAAGMETVAANISGRVRSMGTLADLPNGVDAISESPIRRCMDCYAASLGGEQQTPAEPVATADGVTLKPIDVVGVKASSEMPSDNSFHAAGNVLDGRPDTWWGEGAAGDGIGEWIELTWNNPSEVREIRLVGGCQAAPDASMKAGWTHYNRVRKIRIDIGVPDGPSAIFMADLEDREGFQSIGIPPGTVGTSLRIRILEVFQGADSAGMHTESSGIAEIQVMAVQ